MVGREAVASVGQILKDSIKTRSAANPTQIEDDILQIVMATVVTPEQSSHEYEKRCDDFLASVVAVNGMPVRSITSGEKSSTIGIGLPSGRPLPLRALNDQKTRCVKIYYMQAKHHFSEEIRLLREALSLFLIKAFYEKLNSRELNAYITKVKSAFRDLTTWDRFFSIVKSGCFHDAVSWTLALEGGPIAAVWRYSILDETGEFHNLYDHKPLEGRTYAIRGSWADEKGLMTAGPHAFFDGAPIPREDFDCRCSYLFIYSLRDLPENMLTPAGKDALDSARARVAQLLGKTI